MLPVVLKSRVCEFLVSSFLAPCSLRTVTEGHTDNSYLCVFPPFLFIVFTQFLFPFCVPMDPLVRPEFLLLLLEQGDRSLEDHTRLFLCVANATSYPDDALCSFYDASLNTASRALSSEDGPREDFAAFVEWTLASNGSPLTIFIASLPQPYHPAAQDWLLTEAKQD